MKKIIFLMFTLSSIIFSNSNSKEKLSTTEVSMLYVSIFNRASEGSGNTYWQDQGTMAEVANKMLNTDDAKNYFGDSLNSNESFIEHIYRNTLNKSYYDDPEGISYWVRELNSGKSRGEVVASLVNAVLTYEHATDPKTQTAYRQFVNRVFISDEMSKAVYEVPENYKVVTSFDHDLKVDDSDESKINILKKIYSISSNNTQTTKFIKDDGRLLGSVSCAQCHGTNGISKTSWDSISGEGEFLEESFKKHPIMQTIADGYNLNEKSIIDDWLNSLSRTGKDN